MVGELRLAFAAGLAYQVSAQWPRRLPQALSSHLASTFQCIFMTCELQIAHAAGLARLEALHTAHHMVAAAPAQVLIICELLATLPAGIAQLEVMYATWLRRQGLRIVSEQQREVQVLLWVPKLMCRLMQVSPWHTRFLF